MPLSALLWGLRTWLHAGDYYECLAMSAAVFFNLLTPQWGDVGCEELSGQEPALGTEEVTWSTAETLKTEHISYNVLAQCPLYTSW